MRARNILLVGLALLPAVVSELGCGGSSDLRTRSAEDAQSDGRGAWISLTMTDGRSVAGELIAVGPALVHVLTLVEPPRLVEISRAKVARAELWGYGSAPGPILVWGTFGAGSTVSHGVFLPASLPVWALTTLIAAVAESSAPVVQYPGDSWDTFAMWARFPLGAPAGIQLSMLRAPTGAPSSTAPPSDAGVGAKPSTATVDAGVGPAAAAPRDAGAHDAPLDGQ